MAYTRRSNWFSIHTHSNFSVIDGMSPVADLVALAAKDGRQALGLTDHGNMAGAVQLYKAAQESGIQPWIGSEWYLIDPLADDPMDGKNKRFHLGLLALDLKGYQGLIGLMNLAHSRPRYNRFPRVLLQDLAKLGKTHGKHIVLTTGCYFGLAQQAFINGGVESAERVIKTYASMFPNTVVEIQNHNITHEDGATTDLDIAMAFTKIADDLGLPLMATQDSHYAVQKQKSAHALMKRMVYGGAEDEFPGDSFHLATSEWVADHYPQWMWDKVEETSKWLLDKHKLSIPPLDKFTAHVPKMAADPNIVLQSACSGALDKFVGRDMHDRNVRDYWERLTEEVSVIQDLGMADYFLLVLDFVQWCRSKQIAIEARGSANGSLVCFLLGITQVDPMKWGTLFERFLSRDRTKPPDIDIDIEADRRPEALAELRKRFVTIQIGTWSELGSTVNNPERGSVLVTYQSWLRRKCEELGIAQSRTKGEGIQAGKQLYSQHYGWVRSIDDVKRVDRVDWEGLRQLADMHSVRRSYGVHAGGVLLAGEGLKIDDFVPKMLVASSNTTVTQFDMDDVEQLGFLKLDLLGQRTLTVMKVCQKLIGRKDPCDFTWIPEDDFKACMLLRQGRTDNGIFHFEGYTKAKGGREMNIRTTADAVLATALYMPGAMDSGQKDHYLKYRQNVALRKSVQYLHPAYQQALSPTYGAVVFQEQPLQILRSLKMSIENINVMFKIVKSSGKGAVEANKARLAKLKDEFDRLALEAGIAKEDLAEAWHLVTGFIAYGFNKGHAAGYGIRSYRCAYLKAHHPVEFMAALLMVWAGDPKKEPIYERETRRLGIPILPPDVNRSKESWTVDVKRGLIRRGLMSLKGVGPKAAFQLVSNAPFSSVMDMCKRAKLSGGVKYVETGGAVVTGVIRDLWNSGAIDSLIKRK